MISWRNLKWNTFNPFWGRPLSEIQSVVVGWEQADVCRTEQLGFAEVKADGIALAFKEQLYILSHRERFDPEGPLILVAVHLYAKGAEGFSQFKGELPAGIQFRSSAEDVRAKLGPPFKSGGGNVALNKRWPLWDRYTFPDCAVAVQYGGERQTVDVLTVMSLSEVL